MSSEITEQHIKEEEYFDKEFWRLQENAHVPDWHLTILEERMARYASEDKTKWTTLEEFEKEIEEFMNSLNVKKS